MEGMTPEQFIALVEHRKWVAAAFIAIWFTTRLLKNDVRFLPSVPGRWRPFVPFAFAFVSAIAEKVLEGRTWTSVIVGAFISAGGAVVFQDLFINALRAGKELPVPGLMIEGARPADDKPVTVHPPAAVDPGESPKPPSDERSDA